MRVSSNHIPLEGTTIRHFLGPMSTHAYYVARGLPPTDAALARRRPVATNSLPTVAAIWLAYAASLYPLLLCFLNTRVARMPNASLIIAEVLIFAAATPVLIARLNLGLLLAALCICVNYFVLALVQQGNDFKAVRDLLMPVIFVWLGYALSNRVLAERVLRNLALFAVALGLFEFIFPTLYATVFDTIAFYTARGFGGSNPFALTVLQVRPEGIGRSLFPFLGPRRISSYFLEPVALGNFAVLTAGWALSKPREELRDAAVLMALAAAMIVMADARFGSISILVMCAVRLCGIWKVRLVAALLPFAAMALMVATVLYGPAGGGDNILGRFQVSGNNLLSMPWSAWLGIPNVISLDAGYGYIIQRTGIVICLFLWFLFSVVPLKDDQARRFHFNAAAYIALNLTVSGSSLFSLKTTAILWLLLGAVIAHRSSADTLRVSPTLGNIDLSPGLPRS